MGPYSGKIFPDKLVYISDIDGNDEIYVMNADGTNLTQLTYNTANDERLT